MMRITALFLFFTTVLFAAPAYFYDSNQVRYELYKSNGGRALNWLFIPGGPGFDSIYLRGLVDELKLSGNVWLIDLPGNGSNQVEGFDYDRWIEIFPAAVKRFENVILVGHSFGGMLPMLFPELENQVKGFVILHSLPHMPGEEELAYSKQFNLPDYSEDFQKFLENPNSETFQTALDACFPYYFSPEFLEKGKASLANVPVEFGPLLWWNKKAVEIQFSANWIPQKVPTMIIGAKYDMMCPVSSFEKDQRFQRSNIESVFIEEGGHFSWIENPAAVRKAFREFTARL